MLNRKFAGLLAGIMTVASAFQMSAGSISAENSDSYNMNVNVNLSGEKKPISPYIYGINQYGNQENYKNVAVNAVRQGGNRMTAYNWENNASNAGSDWKYSSDNNLSNSDEPADCVQKLSNEAATYSIDYKLTTLQMAGYAAADKDGTVEEADAAPSDRWNKVEFTKDSAFAETPDLTDGVVYMDEYVNYIINKLGDSESSTGIQGYSLDNEPVLWSNTHSLIHPGITTHAELTDKSIELAAAVKKLDPGAEIFGPALYGYTAYDHLDDDDSSDEWETLKAENGYNWYIDCYLDTMKKASDEQGVRLLDVLDIHYYSESAREGVEDRLQSVRTLYEEGFAENSWIGQWCQANIPILPTIQESIDKYYPGTKLAISEYNFGGGEDVSGTIAQAEALGCFADEGVYFASLWGNGDYILSGINLYTNYDGSGSSFGDTLVETKTDDVSLASAYAAIDGTDDSEVTMVLSNKDLNKTENAKITLDGTDTDYQSVVVYAVTNDSSDIRIIDVQNNIENNTVTVELPPLSVAQVVIADTPTDKTVYETPDTEIKTVTYNYSELEDSENGYKMIPLGDVEHLTKAVINTTSSCSSASSWYGGGGALTFNNLIPESGDAFWGAKSFMFGPGTEDCTVTFDGYFTNGDQEEISASIGDTYSELQSWWASSSNDDTGADVTVTYNTITLYYEYENTTPTSGEETVWGDADESGEVEIADAVKIMCHLTDPENNTIGAQGIKNGDVYQNGDGLSVQDALAIQQYLAQIISTLPVS